MKWILIFVLTRYNFGAIDHIEFNTQKSCEIAREAVMHQESNGTANWAICIEKPPTPAKE